MNLHLSSSTSEMLFFNHILAQKNLEAHTANIHSKLRNAQPFPLANRSIL
jgi:hypothetical protein